MARQGGRVQLEQSDMHLASNMAKMAKGGFSRAAIGETQFRIKQPWSDVLAEQKRRVEYPGHENVKAAMEWQPAMLRGNQMDGCLQCHNGTPQNPQKCWRRKGTVAPPPEQLRQLTPEPTPQPPETPLVPPGNKEAAHPSEIEGVWPGYMYIHTPLTSAQFVNHDAYAKDRERIKDFDPDLLTDEETSTG